MAMPFEKVTGASAADLAQLVRAPDSDKDAGALDGLCLGGIRQEKTLVITMSQNTRVAGTSSEMSLRRCASAARASLVRIVQLMSLFSSINAQDSRVQKGLIVIEP